jgi:hypothetical protein
MVDTVPDHGETGRSTAERPAGPKPSRSRPSPALRLLTDDGRLLRWRPAVVIAGLGARARAVRGFAIWPDPHSPIKVADLSSAQAAEWLRNTFPDRARPGARGWIVREGEAGTIAAMRARALLVGRPGSILIDAVERALGRRLKSPRLALYSPSGMRISKVIHLVFERGRHNPTVAVLAMAEAERSDRLRAEVEVVGEVRGRLSANPSLAAGLPLPPLLAETIGDEYLVVTPVDPLAGATGGNCRAAALEWLRGFQGASSGRRLVSEAYRDRELRALRRAWERLRADTAADVSARAGSLMLGISESTTPYSMVHGDFWRGNIAHTPDGALRVFDWEWAEEEGHPALDLLSFEVGEVRVAIDAMDGERLETTLAGGVDAVARELEARGLEGRAAPALLAPVVGRLAERAHRMVRGPSDPLVRLMAATERVLARY